MAWSPATTSTAGVPRSQWGSAGGASRASAMPGHGSVGPAVRRALAACLALAALSLLLPSVPTYDPWSWIVWGREVVTLDLDTTNGPSWKPLPVLLTAPFALAGDAAPALWLWAARAGGLVALLLAYRLGARLAGPVAGAVAAVGLVLVPDWLRWLAHGNVEGIVAALALGAVERHLAGRPLHALGSGYALALARPEAWPLLGLYGLVLWLREPRSRATLIGLAAALPVLWFGPDVWGSGDAFQGTSRARHMTPARWARSARGSWRCSGRAWGSGRARARRRGGGLGARARGAAAGGARACRPRRSAGSRLWPEWRSWALPASLASWCPRPRFSACSPGRGPGGCARRRHARPRGPGRLGSARSGALGAAALAALLVAFVAARVGGLLDEARDVRARADSSATFGRRSPRPAARRRCGLRAAGVNDELHTAARVATRPPLVRRERAPAPGRPRVQHPADRARGRVAADLRARAGAPSPRAPVAGRCLCPPPAGRRSAASPDARTVRRASPPHGPVVSGPMRGALLACLGLAALSLLGHSAPSYDPWAWIIWGREIVRCELSTAGGPSWKPLPVALTALFGLFGDDLVAPGWLLVARAGALLALVIDLPRGPAHGRPVAGIVAVSGLALASATCATSPRRVGGAARGPRAVGGRAPPVEGGVTTPPCSAWPARSFAPRCGRSSGSTPSGSGYASRAARPLSGRGDPGARPLVRARARRLG